MGRDAGENMEERKQRYETALIMAQFLDHEEEESFVMYKPKFIADTEYKL